MKYYCDSCDVYYSKYTIRFSKPCCYECFEPIERAGVITIWGFVEFDGE